ncbi:hypothetical protein AB0F81_47815 [Actinoplanes sp. NPDC024001]|uniref:hypothetical protein n=1 Tax=Actinoplanes sp. NPDC024001 TaxID=3154598 RepID=UPI0033C9D3AA
MRVEVMPELPAEMMDEAWDWYRDTFDELRYMAANRHLMYRDEFDALMADKRADKYLALDAEGQLVGMGVQTTDLESVPLISPDYFEYHWPELFAQRRLFYVTFVGSRKSARGAGVFVALLRAMYAPIGEVNGRVFVDICSYNEERHALPRMIAMILSRAAGRAQPTRLDAQSFWMYEFPPPHVPVRDERRTGFRERRPGMDERRAHLRDPE